jgi:hypothetical protein
MIGDANPTRDISRNVVLSRGKWPGSASPANGLYTPTQRNAAVGVAGPVWRGWTLTRTGTGLYTLQWTGPSNVSSSVAYFGMTRGDVISSTNRYDPIWVKTENAATGAVTIEITLGGTATDPGSAELIRWSAELCESGVP